MASLDPNELEILQVLWEHGAMKPAEIQARLSRPVKNSALRWQLGLMVESKQLARRKVGKAFYYEARVPRLSAFQKLTRRLAEIFTGGSAAALIGQLIESQEDLSEEDVRALRRIAARKVNNKNA